MTVKNPDLLPLFEELRELLKPYESHLEVRNDEPGRYELWSTTDIAPPGRKRHEPYFAGLIIQKSYVGLYYMPIYTDPEIAPAIGSELRATLHGKSCFYIKMLTPDIRQQIISALEIGYRLYERKGWVGESSSVEVLGSTT